MDICVVLVTYNRLEKLKTTLKKYDSQTVLPQYIMVIDNNSTDGTSQFLDAWKQEKKKYIKIVYHLDKNSGGAGGFYYGMSEAMNLPVQWFYLADDDAYPRNNNFAELKRVYDTFDENLKEDVVALCSAVYHDERIDRGHRVNISKKMLTVKFPGAPEELYKQPYFCVDILSYVGSLIKTSAIKKAGLVDKDFFIYQDDQEHSLRLNKVGKIIVVPSSIIDHDTAPSKYKGVTWGKYYATRNKLLMIKKHFPRKYFFVRYYLGYVRDCILEKNKEAKMLFKSAYLDAKKNKKGLHELYKPGWKVNEDEKDK